jgi:hypothetical protein
MEHVWDMLTQNLPYPPGITKTTAQVARLIFFNLYFFHHRHNNNSYNKKNTNQMFSNVSRIQVLYRTIH